MNKLTPIQHKILKVLVERRRFLTTSKIAAKARISWNTAEKYLKRFYNRGWLSKRNVGNRTYWKARIRKRR